ncbi:MAG: hypothetical protein ACTSRR_00430 [Candidatus Heimdallarchaeaceae archaeon]
MIDMDEFCKYYPDIPSVLSELKNKLSHCRAELSDSLFKFIERRIDYFEYRYNFLNLPITETDYIELLKLEKKLCSKEKLSNLTIQKHEEDVTNESGFKVSYSDNGPSYSYKYCILASVTYSKNKALIEKCKEYSSTQPFSKKFYIYKKWLPELKEHAIYCDNKKTIEEITDFITNKLGGSVRTI